MSKFLKTHAEKFVMQNRYGNLLKFEDLKEEDRNFVSMEVLSSVKEYEDAYDAYMSILSKYAIMCPHPQVKRLYPGGVRCMFPKNTKWYSCTMCKCAVINDQFVDDEPNNSPIERAK
jgi:hypothetical protein